MGIINDTLSSILQIDKKNMKNFVVFIIILGVLFPFIDSLFIKPLQIRQEIEILKEINSLNKISLESEIEENLMNDIIVKAEKLVFDTQPSFNIIEKYKDDPWKFYSGIILWIMVFFGILSQKEKWYKKLGTLLALVVIIGIIGGVGLLLPIIISPWVNYILYPFLQIIFIISLLKIEPKKKVN